ncbi:ABC transporter permease subunit [Salipaludibacillus sp. CF4.18]|uniref:ABC transporter permease subunit n=1 Tax=Salipaludibacillus sp. CF4.18 TaxID=3373081 RepID=UPI003EE59E7B
MTKSRIFWPLVVLALILLVNLFYNPGFFVIEVRNGQLTGSLINILNRGAPLILISIGMTLVIATKGIDLGVGSVIAMSGAIAAMVVGGTMGDTDSLLPLFIAVGLAIVLSMATGTWNGLLVSVYSRL